MPYYPLGKLNDFPEGNMRAFNVDGQELVVVRADGVFYAFANLCTHRQDYLTNGFVENGRVICAYHDAVFDMTTGQALAGPAYEPLPVYNLRTEADEVQIEWPRELPEAAISTVDHEDEPHRFAMDF